VEAVVSCEPGRTLARDDTRAHRRMLVARLAFGAEAVAATSANNVPVMQPDRLDPDPAVACYADLAGGFTADRGATSRRIGITSRSA
jgi:hypothetical protein